MNRLLTILGLAAICLLLLPPPANAQVTANNGRDPEDKVEAEGHFGFYWNINFPTGVRQNPAYTSYLTANVAPTFHPLFSPEIRSKDFRWHWGTRVSYDFLPRWALEYTFEMSQNNNYTFQPGYLEVIVPAAAALVPGQTLRRLRRQAGYNLMHHGNLVFHARSSGRFVPYLTGGFSVIQYGHGPLIDFIDTGSSQFGVFGYEHRHTKFGGNIGVGVKLYATRHVGVRVDGRFLLAPSRFTQRGATNVGAGFGPDVTQTQRGLYSDFILSFGIFGRF